MVKRIAILGSTGSVGKNALRVIDSLNSLPEKELAAETAQNTERYEIVALTAHSSVKLLAEQAKRYKPKFVAITNADYFQQLSDAISDLDVEILAGPDSLTEIAQLEEVDIVLTAVVGAAGLPAVLAAAQKGKRLAIANKEPLVIAGELLTKTAEQNGSTILPVDSEHSAIWQALRSGSPKEVCRIILTASGGPFRKATTEDIQNVTLEQD